MIVPVAPGGSAARALVLSIFFAPCSEVGGKRFNNLSGYLSQEFAEYHVVARREKRAKADATAFRGNVHRTGMLPWFPPKRKKGLGYKASRFWAKWVCQVDPYIGWVVPATLKGISLCRRHRLNIVIVTAPAFSTIIAGMLVSRATGCKLIVDYRDEWTNHRQSFHRPFGKYICPRLERAAIRQASAVVVCTDMMREHFMKAFGAIAPPEVRTIYNGYDENGATKPEPRDEDIIENRRTNMVYAGAFYGKRRISLIAPALSDLLRSGVISVDSFRFHLYSHLTEQDYAVMEKYGIDVITEVHEPVSYEAIRTVMEASDILFLPSGDDFEYAVPFKFFDYLRARRPVLAVASRTSAVRDLVETVDCGICAEIGNRTEIAAALKKLVRHEEEFTWRGAERFTWMKAASGYSELVDRVVRQTTPELAIADD